MRVWVGGSQFFGVGEDRAVLASEIASLDRSPDFSRYLLVLPDPDPVLKKLGKDLTVYRDLLADAHVEATIGSRFSGVQRREWAIDAADESAAAAKAADIGRAAFERLDVDRIIGDALEAVEFGYAVLEVIWGEVGGYWLPVDIVGKPQEWFAFGTDGKLRFKSRERPIDGELLPEFKFLVVQNRARYTNPYGERVLSRCFWPVTFKRGGLKFWATFVEKYGSPYLIGKVPKGTPKADKEALLDKLDQMILDAVAVIPDDASVEILTDASRASSAEIYQGLIAACNAEISKAVVGQTLTTEIGETGGAYAASQTHQEVRGDIVDRDSKLVASAFRRVLGWVTAFNAPGAPFPAWRWHEEEDIRADLAERDAKLRAQGIRFTAEYYERKYGLARDEFEIREDPAPTAFAEGPRGARPDVRRVDRLVAAAVREASPAVQGMIETVAQEAEKAASFEELIERVYAMYPRLDAARLVDVLARAGFNADAFGRAEANGEVGR